MKSIRGLEVLGLLCIVMYGCRSGVKNQDVIRTQQNKHVIADQPTGITRQESSERVTLHPPTDGPNNGVVTRPSHSFPIPDTLVRFELIRLNGGQFKSLILPNEPIRELTLKPFWIGKYEVTWGEFIFYYACPLEDVDGRSTASLSLLNISIPGNYFEHDRPVVALRWHSAMAYCRWLSKKTGHLYRLPTEVEWEYACQAGSDKAAPENLGEYAWFVKNSDVRTHMGGGKISNAFGIHDMLGNVWEYCLESYKPPDFVPVFRGGGWDSPADELRANRRQPLREEWFERDPSRPRSGWWLIGGASQGFRIVRVADASDTRDREAYSSKIEINVLRHKEIMTTIGSSKEPYVRVWGQVKNAGDRLLQELHILICFLDNEGRRHLMDKAEWGPMQRPTYAYCFPVLVHSFHPGTHREPLRPAETRDFVVDLPMAYDEDVLLDKYSAQVAGLVFARD